MEFVQRVRKTDLARNTRQVISAVQRGQTAVIESHGEPEAAVIDIVDYRIMRAVIRCYASQQGQRGGRGTEERLVEEQGLSEQEVEALTDVQTRYDLVLGRYLAEAISLARAAELLGLTWLDLRSRFLRLDVPLRTAPADATEAALDADTAATWARRSA